VIYVNAILVIVMGYGMNFGLWVQMELFKHEKSLTWLADRIGSHPSLLCKWRSGLSNPKTEYFLLVVKEISILKGISFESTLREAAESMGIKL
jgi:hypothetical protein